MMACGLLDSSRATFRRGLSARRDASAIRRSSTQLTARCETRDIVRCDTHGNDGGDPLPFT